MSMLRSVAIDHLDQSFLQIPDNAFPAHAFSSSLGTFAHDAKPRGVAGGLLGGLPEGIGISHGNRDAVLPIT